MRLCDFYITGQGEAIWLNGFGLKWPMCRDRHPEIFWKSGQIWQNDPSWRGEIWEFEFSQDPGGAGIHPGGFVLMSGPQKPNYFLIWAIWGQFGPIFPYYPIIWGSPLGSLLAPIGSYWPLFVGGSWWFVDYSLQISSS